MSTPISPYEPLLDQCEAPVSSLVCEQALGCCEAKQSVGELVPVDSNSANHQLSSLQEVIEALTLQHLHANTAIENIANLLHSLVTTHRRGELERAAILFTLVADELRPHMLKEERVLFPFVIRLEKAEEFHLQSLLSPFAGLQNPMRVMTVEHDAARDLFEDLRSTMLNYNAPKDACAGYRLLCEALSALEIYLARHFAIEQEVLYPRAAEMQSRIDRHG